MRGKKGLIFYKHKKLVIFFTMYNRSESKKEAFQEIDMEAGIVAEDKQKEEAKLQMEAEGVVEKFYSEIEDINQNKYLAHNDQRFVFTEIKKHSQEVKSYIFASWFKRDPWIVMYNLRAFDILPNKFQDQIAQHLFYDKNSRNDEGIAFELLKTFEKIINPQLVTFITEHSSIDDLIENKDKLPPLDFRKLFGRFIHDNSTHHMWVDWANIIPYIDNFPWINKRDAVVNCLRQGTNHRSSVLLKHKEKIGLSMEELIDLFFQYNCQYHLVRHIELIDPRFHQEIVDRVIGKNDYYGDRTILENAGRFSGVDLPRAVRSIAQEGIYTKNRSLEKTGLELLANNINHLVQWVALLDADIIDRLVEEYPSEVLRAYDPQFFKNAVDLHKLVDQCCVKSKYSELLNNKHKINFLNDDELALKIIEHGGTKSIPYALFQLSKLSKSVFDALCSTKDSAEKVAHQIESFLVRGKEEALKLIEQGQSQSVAHNFHKFKGLDQEIVMKLVEGGQGSYLANDFESFHLDFSQQYGALYEFIKPILIGLIRQNIWPVFTLEDVILLADKQNKLSQKLFPIELHHLAQTKQLATTQLTSEEGYHDVYKNLTANNVGEWSNPDILQWFESAAVDTPDAPAWATYKEIFDYMGTSSRHDKLNVLPQFIKVMREVEENDTDCRKIVSQLFKASGMGTGLQSLIFRDIMSTMTADVWHKLRTDSVYPHVPPALSDVGNLNLQRIKNEIKLLQMPEIMEKIKNLPPDQETLKIYALDLLEHPTINVEAVKNFVDDPSAFFASRTGAGETGVVDKILSAMSPDAYPHWSAAESRDSLVDGTYDRLNAFPAVTSEWQENSILTALQEDAGKFLSSFEEQPDIPQGLIFLKNLNTYSSEVADEVWQNLRANTFIECIDIRFEISQAYLTKNAPKALDKAFEYQLKRDTAYLDGLIVKREKSTFASDKEQLKRFKEEKEKLAENVETKKQETMQLLTDAQAGKQESARNFWRALFGTGWLKKMELGDFARRVTGEDHGTEEMWMQSTLEHSPNSVMLIGSHVREAIQLVVENTESIWYQADVLRPSDPETATAGSTTGNCDAFGHGKKAHFMVNPGVSQMVLRERRGGTSKPTDWSSDDIIAQSTITLDKLLFDNPKQREVFMEALLQYDGKIGHALVAVDYKGTMQEFLEKYTTAKQQICLDSVEIPPNTREKLTPQAMFTLLQKGVEGLAMEDLFYNCQVVAGTQYSYITTSSSPTVDNHGIWVTPLAYSDNPPNIHQAVLLQKASETGAQTRKPETGMRPATPQDAFAIGIMEELAFKRTSGEQYITGFIHMAQELYSSALQSEHRGLPPLAFIDTAEKDGKQMYNGYLIAFEQGKDQIYITDTATTGTEKGTGTKLILALIKSVASSPKTNKKRITMDCRGATSARALANPKSKALIEGLEFIDTEGTKVRYQIQGPDDNNIKGDGLYHFEFIPKVSG